MSIKRTKDPDIKFGVKDQLKDTDFDSQNVGHRISIVIPENVLMAYRQTSSDRGLRYQSLMNDVLKKYIFSEQAGTLEARIKILEEKVFKRASK